jgi:putative glutamine amidotransferase
LKPVLISQRVDVWRDRGERRDALDQRLVDFLAACGAMAIPVPNRADRLSELWTFIRPAGIVLSGGNDLVAYGGDAPERDELEAALLQRAIQTTTPVLGICRGMQHIAHFFGGQLGRVNGHVGTRHRLQGRGVAVNSFHQWTIVALPDVIEATDHAEDGCIESIRHRILPILGLMWHPEREAPFNDLDLNLVRQLLG